MRKILYIENVASIYSTSFYMTAAMAAKRTGFEFHLAYNAADRTEKAIEELKEKYGIIFHQVDFIRTPYDPRNIKAYKQLCKLIKNEQIDYIHCNTPIGGVVGRLAAKKCKIKKTIYQVHGFHFYDGAPKVNWLIYYPIERWLSHYCDAIITINKEDFKRVQHFRLRRNGKTYYVPGVGIDVEFYKTIPDSTREAKRGELGFTDEEYIILSAGELNENKNNTVIVSALSQLKDKRLHYILCGVGPEEQVLKEQVKKSALELNVQFLGFRRDLSELLKASDLFVMPSFREGLSRSIMEAMASGLPCIVSNIRGNVDLIDNEAGGFTCNPNDVEAFTEAINKIVSDTKMQDKCREYNLKKIDNFSSKKVTEAIGNIYNTIFGNAI